MCLIYERWVRVVGNGYGDKLGAEGMGCWGVCVCVHVFVFRELESSQTGFRKSEKNIKKRRTR